IFVNRLNVGQRGILPPIHEVELLTQLLYTVARLNVDSSSARLTFPGGDQDNAIGTSGSVNRGGRCVFEYLNALDFSAVQVGRTTREWKAVYYIKRLISTLN